MAQVAIVQARMSSRRLPGKVLSEVAGKAMLGYLVERLQRCRLLEHTVVATSSATSDDAVEQWCHRQGVVCFRGPLDDVVERFLQVAAAFRLSAFVRINADSPLMSPVVVDQVVALFEAGGYDLATNVFPRSFPKGQSVEVIRVATLARAATHMTPEDREHVTSYFYRHPESFSIRNAKFHRDASDVQMSVDSIEDLLAFEQLLANLERPHWDYSLDELLARHDHRAPAR